VAEAVPPAETAANGSAAPGGALRLWTNTRNYRVGDEMRIYFEVAAPMHLRIVSYSSSGAVAELFPNQYQPDDFVRPGQRYQLPASNAPFTLHVEGPAGADKLFAVGSRQAFPASLEVVTRGGEFSRQVVDSYPVRASTWVEIR
jgi:hypothetical protein